MAELQWWGYLHVNGTVQVKRYFDERAIEDALASDFVIRVVWPFVAENRDDALRIIGERLMGR